MFKKQCSKRKINITGLVKLLDSHELKWKNHTTPIIGLVGEDINAAIFVDYWKRRKRIKAKDIEVCHDGRVNQGTKQGRRLDRWIKVGNDFYQAEIKNWCSFRIGSYELPLNSSKQKVEKLATRHWMREKRENWAGQDDRISKVLSKMKDPVGFSKDKHTIKPLVIHWMPISNKRANPFFSVSIKSLNLNKYLLKKIGKATKFKSVYYFSSSLYLRELLKSGIRTLDLYLPNVEKRLSALREFLKL